jgi:hypothetical protein
MQGIVKVYTFLFLVILSFFVSLPTIAFSGNNEMGRIIMKDGKVIAFVDIWFSFSVKVNRLKDLTDDSQHYKKIDEFSHFVFLEKLDYSYEGQCDGEKQIAELGKLRTFRKSRQKLIIDSATITNCWKKCSIKTYNPFSKKIEKKHYNIKDIKEISFGNNLHNPHTPSQS